MNQWSDQYYIGGDGILTGCDENQEWMLKWWFENYTKSNTLPITFIDFGMTQSAKLWCKTKGNLISISLPKKLIAQKKDIPQKNIQLFEKLYTGDVWAARPNWFAKPFAFLKTPYDRSLWIDLDCQVLKPIDDLIPLSEKHDGIAITKEVSRAVKFSQKHNLLLKGETIYNSGVLAFKRKTPIIQKWIQNIINHNQDFLGDQEVLNRTIFNEKFKVFELPPHYNWRPQDGVPPETVILHFACAPGKNYIFRHL